MIGPLTYLDAGVIAIAFISGLLALYRGLTRELLAILSWIIAAVTVLYFILNHRQFATEVAEQMGAQLIIAQAVIGVLLFLIVLIVVHLVTARISDSILDSQVGMIDRILGFVFGLVRGFILVVIPFMLALHFYPKEEQHPDWLAKSITRPYLLSTGEALQSMLVAYVVPVIDRATNKQDEASHQQDSSIEIRGDEAQKG
ncbi:CvpA family protein [Filomicrobium sp.]|uniref:CvpA family protein n=1 Tax=Filomicrobium sp. TaxID=2024831 RepID=UPI00258F1499|nr:CvpA family protein [Filomicrobium sp.]MCV0371519.1 CvpA family protein [Filomicrobium sp.]